MYKLGGTRPNISETRDMNGEEHLIYCSLESTTDGWRYKMFDKNGIEHDISLSSENEIKYDVPQL